MESKKTSPAVGIGSPTSTGCHASPAPEPAAKQKDQHKLLTSPTFRPNLDEAFSHHIHHTNKDKCDARTMGGKSVSERLYDDARHRMDQLVKNGSTKRQSSPQQAKKNTASSMDSPFQPDLTDAFSHHRHQSDSGKDADKPVSDRLYEDAVHRKKEIAAGVVDSHCRHELDRERLKHDGGGRDEDHVHLKSRRDHPFATDLCPKADYLRRMDSSMSIDGGSIEDGIYPDSSVSSDAGDDDLIERCECGNIIQLALDLDAAVHPAATFGDGTEDTFSPDISETQKVVASPRNTHVHTEKEDKHGKTSNSVFDRLYKDKEQRERRLTMEKLRIKKEDEKELTFHPHTNIKHDEKEVAKRKSARKQSIEKNKARKCLNCLQESLVKQTQNVTIDEESASDILEKDLRLEEESEDSELNGPLLEPGDTFAALAASQPQ